MNLRRAQNLELGVKGVESEGLRRLGGGLLDISSWTQNVVYCRLYHSGGLHGLHDRREWDLNESRGDSRRGENAEQKLQAAVRVQSKETNVARSSEALHSTQNYSNGILQRPRTLNEASAPDPSSLCSWVDKGLSVIESVLHRKMEHRKRAM